MTTPAVNFQLRGQLAEELSRFIADNNYTQVHAAEILGVTQPRVSNLIRKKLELFTIDMLVSMLARVGYQIEINMRHMVAE